jgi:hypothetical protein
MKQQIDAPMKSNAQVNAVGVDTPQIATADETDMEVMVLSEGI